jgi:parvulin-like peptidyl-prolyl isomerase
MPPRTQAQRRREERDRRRRARRPRTGSLPWRDLPNAWRDWSTLSRPQRVAAGTKSLLFVSVLVVAIVVALVGAALFDEFIATPARPVATVAGVPISADTYRSYLAFRRFELGQVIDANPATATPEQDPSIRDPRSQLSTLVFDAVSDLVAAELVRGEVESREIRVAPDDIAAASRRVLAGADPPTAATQEEAPPPAAEPGGDDPRRRLRDGTGLDDASLDVLLADRARAQRLTDDLVAGVGPAPAQIRAAQILVATEDDAERVIARLEAFQTFETIAADASLDPGARENGGELGWLPRGVMSPEWDGAAFALRSGRVSAPVQTQLGWVVIKLLESSDSRPLDSEVAQRLRKRAFDDWLQGAIADAGVTYTLDAEIIRWAQRHLPGA